MLAGSRVDPKGIAVISCFHLQRLPLLRLPRRFFAAFVLTMYLLAGALHGLCDLDVTNNSGTSIVASIKNDIGQSEKGVIAEHHCHGCFSVAIPAPITTSLVASPTHEVSVASSILLRGLPLGLDPPPPKFFA